MATTEMLDTFFLNQVLVAGVVSKFGIKTSTQDNGAKRASFSVMVQEQGSEGRVYTRYVDVEAWGKVAEQAGTLEAGQWVLVEGKLNRSQRKPKGATEPVWYTVVEGRRVQVLEQVVQDNGDAEA